MKVEYIATTKKKKRHTGGRITLWRRSSVDANKLIADVTVHANPSRTLQLLCSQA